MNDKCPTWSEQKKILIILAHPDDPEFFLGGTIAKWISEGHTIHYCLLTKGDKGSSDHTLTNQQVAAIRIKEQNDAAEYLGISTVTFLNYPDGYLIPDLETRKQVVRILRKIKPEILVTCDPLNYFANQRYINHPDHRAAGQIVIDAVFPASGNTFFFPELIQEGLLPHSVEEVWLSLTGDPDIILDLTSFWETRLSALKMHKTQIGQPEAFENRMKGYLDKDEKGNIIYQEKFKRIVFRRK